jgi:hypothetical protein
MARGDQSTWSDDTPSWAWVLDNQHRREDKPLPVRSCVVSLWKRAKMAPSPLRLTLPGEPPGQQRERISFSYETIEMWEKRPEDILDLGHEALYPLLPLTKGGTTQQIVTRMFDLLPGRQNRNYTIIGYAFATRTFELLNQSEDLEWLKERFRHMDDDILVGSPVYQWILEKDSLCQGFFDPI